MLGAANKRLYQFRLQTADRSYEKAAVNHPTAGSLGLSNNVPLLSGIALRCLNNCYTVPLQESLLDIAQSFRCKEVVT